MLFARRACYPAPSRWQDGATAGRQDSIPIAEAATLLDLSQEAVRKRINRGTLAGYKRAGGWYVVLAPGDLLSGRQDDRTAGRQDKPGHRQDSEPLEATYRVTPVEIERAVSRTSAQYMGDLRTMLAEVGKVYEGQLAAKDETIAELRRRAERAEAERDRLAAAQDGPGTPEAPTAAAAPGVWGRLRRWCVRVTRP